MKTLYQIVILSVFLLAFTSNSSFGQKDYYAKRGLIIPAHEMPRQFFVSLGYDRGIDLNVSYSLPRNLVLFSMANLNAFTQTKNESLGGSYKITKNDYALYGGLGYFSYNRHKKLNTFELYAGAGTTEIDNVTSSNLHTQANYLTFFGQINAIVSEKKIEYGLGTRIAYNNYSNFKYFYSAPLTNGNVSSFGLLTLEPAINFSYIIANLKANIQVGISLPLYSQEAEMKNMQTNITYLESYGDLYFFWRTGIQFTKSPTKRRR
jgi:hypothetical protein